MFVIKSEETSSKMSFKTLSVKIQQSESRQVGHNLLDRVDTEIGEIEDKIPDHSEYITIPKFNEVPRSIFDIKLNQEIFPTM